MVNIEQGTQHVRKLFWYSIRYINRDGPVIKMARYPVSQISELIQDSRPYISDRTPDIKMPDIAYYNIFR